jgi:hypothetical protein
MKSTACPAVAMSSHFRSIAVLASTALFLAPVAAPAQTLTRAPQSDSRWDPWLGCWGVDTSSSGNRQSSPGVTCVLPIAGSHAVEALTYARGKVVARDRLDSSGEPHTVSGQGCRGFETIDWLSSGRRALLRSDYTCGGTRGSSSTIYAIAPGGDWLRIEQVRSGTGVAVSLERRRPVPLIPDVPAEAARMIEDRRMAITTARAAAATQITTAEVIEAVHIVDPGVVRSWIVVSGQSFDLDGSEVATLIRADVPQSVLAAMMPYETPMPATYVRPVTVYGAAPGNEGPVAYASANANDYDGNGYGGCPSMSCNGSPNPYSILNGYGVYPYGYGAGGFPFSPFNNAFPSIVINNRGNNNNNNRGHNNNGHRPVGRPFVRPVGTTGTAGTVGSGPVVHGTPFAGGRRR